jgi:PKD repeat protein
LKFWSKILFPLLTMFLLVTPASAQYWPMPGKGTGAPCTACVEPAKGKLTYPFNEPLVRHVGRYVDSTTVGNVQNAGMRTVRARQIRNIPGRNRMLVALGEAVGIYDANTFFTTKLGTPMVNVDKAFVMKTLGDWGRYSFPYEKVLSPDAFFYAESGNSKWEVLLQDSQIQLADFDMDDRGYLYVATVSFGWGIAKDNAHSGAKHLDYITQVKDGPVAPKTLFGLHVGSKYYVVISEPQRGDSKLAVHDVTSPAEGVVPRIVASRTGIEAGIVAWDRHDDTQRLAVITADYHLHVYDYADFVAPGGAAPIASYSPSSSNRTFSDVSFDEDGRVWATEKTASPDTNLLWRLSPSGNGYTQATFNVYGTSMVPTVVHAAGGYVAVGGFTPSGNDIVLMKVEGGTPQRLELDNYFRKYYHKAPPGYVALDFRSPSYYQMADIELVERGNKVYLMFGAGSLGDVYELQAGDAISISMIPNSFGTPNASSAATEPGPYYGDILKFKATTNASSSFSIDWDFDNPEAGNANGANSGLNQTVEHQFTGLQNANAVSAPKAVKAEVSNDASISDTLNVSLKVPKARIRIPGRTAAMTQETKADFEVVAGDEFIDASDGVVEGHFGGWTIDNDETRKVPTAKMDVGDLGSHSLAFTAYYGKYNADALSNTTAFKSVINNIDYDVLPFIATIRPPVTTGANYVFDADVRVTQVAELLDATQWTVTWSVEGSSNLTAAQVVDIGEIPPFPVEKTGGLNGKFVTLQIAVDPASVPDDAFATYETSLKLEVPDIQINKTTGCTNAGEPCTLTAVPAGTGSSANWQLQWTIKRGSSTVKSGSTNPITFTPEQGLHTVSVTETAYAVTEETNFNVLAPACGPLPAAGDIDIGWSCGNDCEKNTEIDFEASVFPNTIQPCHQFVWDFGDNTALGSGQGTTHKYTKDGNFKVKVTVKTATSTSNPVKEETISIGGTIEPPPPPVCDAPTGIDFIYTGNLGCSSITGVACKTNELVTFSGRRGTAALASCDNTAWTIDGVPYTAKSPKHTFTTTGNKTVSLTVSNTAGNSTPVNKTLNIAQGTTGNCTGGTASAEQLGISFVGLTSSCGNINGICQLNESIEFTAELFGYTPKTCDQFEWNFGDNSAVMLGRQVTHTYTGARNSARVKLRIYNTSNTTGVFTEVDVPFTTINEEPAPVLAYNGFPTGGAKGNPVTFRVDSNLNATGWSWNFDDGSPVDNSQSAVIGTTTSITHTFTKTGTFNVRVTARNAASPASGRTNFAQGAIAITDTPEYRYLLPVVTHVGGLGGSEWRTDVQIYTQDPNVSPTKPLVMTATLGNVARTLEIFDSTYIYEDFMRTITNIDGTGPVIITARTQYPPQIWTRTYTQTAGGTFGQFIPAIRLDQAGGGAAAGSGKYFLAGLRSNDRYRTNVGLVNPTTSTLPITVAVYDDARAKVAQFTKTVGSLQWYQFNIKDDAPGLKADRPFSIELSVPDAQWLIAYASFLDNGSNDPVYMQAVRESVLNSPDYRNSIVPGVGHVGAWRSDVTVFNPNPFMVNVDLAYHDTTGAKKGEALAIPISAGQFLQYDDILKQGVFSNVVDGLGMLRVTLANADDSTISPMTFARTYHDNGSGKTYGQGIRGFAAAQANVRPGRPALIAGVRNDPKYRTNLGLSNVSSTDATVTVKYLHPATGASMRETQTVLKPFESLVGPISFENHERASIRLEVTGGNVWGFCSIIDRGTQDTEYVEANPLQ